MKIVAVGDNCIDYYDGTGMYYCGGNPINVAVYSVRLGSEASYIGAVGDDPFGKIMTNAITAKNVDISHLKMLPGKTALTHVDIVNGDRVFKSYDEGVLKDFRLNDADIRFILKHDLFVSGFWGKTINDLARIKAGGIVTAFDFATKLDSPEIFSSSSFIDYPFFSYDEGENDFLIDFMKRVKEIGPKAVTVTMGEKGSLCYDGQDFFRFGVTPCQVVDTMGAGDSYIAGFLHGILEGKSIQDCMQLGAKTAAQTIQYAGAW